MTMRKFLTTALIVAGIAFPLNAQAETYKADKSHSYIGFEIDHLGFSVTKGQFHDFDLTVVANWDEIERSGVALTVRTKSIDTAWDARDEHLRKPDFFDVEAHPTMSFLGKKVVKTGEKTAKIIGDLTLRGTTKPVEMDVELVKRGVYPFGEKKEALGIRATTVIKRSEWGMNYAIPAVSDDVKIVFNGELKAAE